MAKQTFHNSQKEELDILDFYGCCVETTTGTYHKSKIYNDEGVSMRTLEDGGMSFENHA